MSRLQPFSTIVPAFVVSYPKRQSSRQRLDSLAYSTHAGAVRVWQFVGLSQVDNMGDDILDTYPEVATALPGAWNRVLGTFTNTLPSWTSSK